VKQEYSWCAQKETHSFHRCRNITVKKVVMESKNEKTSLLRHDGWVRATSDLPYKFYATSRKSQEFFDFQFVWN
jgi:hypothetical protein